MNMSLKTVVSVALFVMLSAGLAIAGRGAAAAMAAAAMVGVGAVDSMAGVGAADSVAGRLQPSDIVSHAFFQHPASEFQHPAFRPDVDVSPVVAEFRRQPGWHRRAAWNWPAAGIAARQLGQPHERRKSWEPGKHREPSQSREPAVTSGTGRTSATT